MSNLELVDNFSKVYGYKHSEVLDLELEFVYSILWMNAEQQVEADNYKAIQRKFD